MESLFKGKAFKLDRDGDVAVVSFDLEGEKVNKFSLAPFEDLKQILGLVKQGGFKALLLRSLKPRSYIVGADLNLVRSLPDRDAAEAASRQGQAVFSQLEDLGIPTLAAIEGPCAGGGTELSLACRHILVSDFEKTAISVPEVKLGFLPGWGGTWRLPGRVGLPTALDLILTGKSVRADKAVKLGLADLVVPEAIFAEKSLEIARGLAQGKGIPGAKPRAVPLPERLLTSNPLGLHLVFKQAREGVIKGTRGNYPAPLRILEVLKKHASLGRDAYLAEEAKAFGDLWATPESKNLVGLFFLTEDAKRNTGTALSAADAAALAPVRECGVLGAGVMGGGIASQTAASHIWTFVKDINFDAVAKALAHARGLFDADFKKKRIKANERDRRTGLIRGQIDYAGFRGLDLVIEAVVENLEVKKKVFAELEGQVRADCVIATNTSSLRLADMAVALKDASRFVGLHFFNPVHKMPLVEVVYLPGTAPEAVTRAVNFVKAIGKTPLVCKDGPGFIVNRLLMPWLNEAGHCLWEGYDWVQMDRVLKDWGMPMGPFELLDEIGIDVASKVAHILGDAFGERAQASPVTDKLSASKRLGRKSGLGFYVWDSPGGKRVKPDAEGVRGILANPGTGRELEQTPEAIVRRTLYPMINEAAVILEERLVSGPDQIDLGMIFGTGFPPFRGGLLRFADSVGLPSIVTELERLAALHGPRFAPTPALQRFAKGGGTFYK